MKYYRVVDHRDLGSPKVNIRANPSVASDVVRALDPGTVITSRGVVHIAKDNTFWVSVAPVIGDNSTDGDPPTKTPPPGYIILFTAEGVRTLDILDYRGAGNEEAPHHGPPHAAGPVSTEVSAAAGAAATPATTSSTVKLADKKRQQLQHQQQKQQQQKQQNSPEGVAGTADRAGAAGQAVVENKTVSCGGHLATSCARCGTTRHSCNGVCKWNTTDERCDAAQHSLKSKSTSNVEAARLPWSTTFIAQKWSTAARAAAAERDADQTAAERDADETVSCGGHMATSCARCGTNRQNCNGVCTWNAIMAVCDATITISEDKRERGTSVSKTKVSGSVSAFLHLARVAAEDREARTPIVSSKCRVPRLGGSSSFEALRPHSCNYLGAFGHLGAHAAHARYVTNLSTTDGVEALAKAKASEYHLPRIVNAMRAAGIPVIISSGTALGFMRECRIFPNDPDMDVWVAHSHMNTTRQFELFQGRLERASNGQYRAGITHRTPEQAGFQVSVHVRACVCVDYSRDVPEEIICGWV